VLMPMAAASKNESPKNPSSEEERYAERMESMNF
jgi:hypothetical protein